MRFAVRFYEEDGWKMADAVRFKRLTQGKSDEEIRRMAQDLLLNCVVWEWKSAREVESDQKLPEGCEWVTIPAKPLLAARIASQRQKSGMTMKEVAAKLGVGISTYQRWESPKLCNAGVDTLERIARAYGKELHVEFV